MEVSYFITQMRATAQTIEDLTRGVTDEQARWKPEADSWSILEIINHLLDEEREDFRVRLEYILHRPGQPWPPIDPQGWVGQRGYQQRDLRQSVSAYLAEREASLGWLEQLASPDWQTVCKTAFGQMTAGDMFAAWVAHDLLHVRQLVELRWAYTVHAARPYQVGYAGEW